MNYTHVVITGGAGFVGSSLCLQLKQIFPALRITALDNLHRRGSELNIPDLRKAGIRFVHGDVRNSGDLEFPDADLIIECSAEPAVTAGLDGSPQYVLDTNLLGAVNCFELARKHQADVIFLSTSRVYPIALLNSLRVTEGPTGFILDERQELPGASGNGISAEFPLRGVRSIYGTTKLAAELLLQEYADAFGIHAVIDRFGVISGPRQMGKVDQGVCALWMAAHVFDKPLRYFGYNGTGKQVRDILHVDDVVELIKLQLQQLPRAAGEVYVAGGGRENAVSLQELTGLCREISGRKIIVGKQPEGSKADVQVYISDNAQVTQTFKWKPRRSVRDILQDLHDWMTETPALAAFF